MTHSLHPQAGTRSPLGTTDLGKRLRIGFITHLDQHDDLSTIYRENLRLIQQLEQIGYDSAWIATRHFKSGWAALPSPYGFLGAAAVATERIGLGTAVLPIVLDDAVRAGEELSAIDHLSGGRLLIGTGKGVPSDSYHVFETWHSDRDRSFEAKIDTLHRTLEAEAVEGGTASLWPPNAGLQGRIFHGSSNIETIRAAAVRGDGLILERFGNGPEREPDQRGTFLQRQADSVTEYHRVFAETWGETRTPYVVTSRSAYPGATTKAALAESSERAAHWNAFAETTGRANPAHTPAEQFLSDNFIWGDPETLAALLLEDPTVPLTDELVLGIHPALHTIDETIEKARVLFEEVVPLVQQGWQAERERLGLSAEQAVAV